MDMLLGEGELEEVEGLRALEGRPVRIVRAFFQPWACSRKSGDAPESWF